MNARKVRWGVLGVASIATRRVIPAMQRGEWSEVVAIASRDLQKASQAASALGVARAHGSYDELLSDPGVDAVYIPLPNHLHVPWTIRAAEAGKHVLCEKPIAMNAREAESLLAVRDRTGVVIQEAFMVRTHPQWCAARDLVRDGRIGQLREVVGCFSYCNNDAGNVRNVVEYGGGGLMDIGCYLVATARWLFDREPARVFAAIDRDPATRVDRLASITLDFESGHAIGTCGTQHTLYQRVQVFGTSGRIDLDSPFHAPPDRSCVLVVDDGRDYFGGGSERIEFAPCNQYTIQGDRFSQAVREKLAPAVPLEDSAANMRVIDALFRSAESGGWQTL
jgi:predicted dehydrogenase